MPARSLYSTAVHWLVKNKDGIDDIGDIPYEKIQPVLLKIERPAQLAQIEQNSPHLRGKTAEIWRGFLLRDVQDYDRNPVEPRDGKSWWKVYRMAKRRADEEQERQEEELVSQLMARKEERDRNTTTVSDKLVVPASERKKNRHATTHARTGDSSRLLFGGGTRTKTNTGAGVMKQVKREMAERQTRMHSLGMTPQRPVHRHNPASNTTHLKVQPQPSRSAPKTAVPTAGSNAPRLPHKALALSRNPRLAAMASSRKKRTESPAPSVPVTATQKKEEPMNKDGGASRPPQDLERTGPLKRKLASSGVFMPAKRRK